MPNQDRKPNINRASLTELQRIEGIDRERANLIMEYRRAHGPFRSWSDLEAVDGLGETLTDKLRTSASLGSEEIGDADGTQLSSNWPGRTTDETDGGGEAEEEQEEPDEEVDALAALARMDLEAAEAYDMAVEAIDDPAIADTLRGFRDDHARHFERINQMIVQRGFEPVEPSVDLDESMFLALVDASVALGPLAALLALISSEQLTNSTYESAMMLGFDEEVMVMLQQGTDDERRHLAALRRLRKNATFQSEEPPLGEPFPPDQHQA
jgi:competence ComEA-like helix-hairpin-helix protein